MTKRICLSLSAVVCLLLVFAGCSTFRQVAALRLVEFALDRVTDAELAGVPLDRVRRYEDLRAMDIARIGGAIAQRRLPFEFRLHVAAQNPEENQVDARLLQLSWTLMLEGRETVSGTLDQEYVLPMGETTYIPLFIELDLVNFFGENMRDLVELALSLSGEGGSPKNVSLQATPTIRTPIGGIRYPRPITIVSRDVG